MKRLWRTSAELYRDGYIVDEDVVEQMSISDIEDTIFRLAKDMYISDDTMREILVLYISARKDKLDAMFEYTEENVRRINEVNELFISQVTALMHIAHEIYQREKECFAKEATEYNNLEVTASLKVPHNVEELLLPNKLTHREVQMWHILSSRHYNRSLDYNPILGSCGTFSMREEREELEERINETLYLSNLDDYVKRTGWACMMVGADQDKLKDICVVWPFHNLYDYGMFAMTDIFKIQKFHTKVEIKYENY